MNELAKIAAARDKGIPDAKNKLALLFRQVLFDLSIDTMELNRKLKLYDNDPNNRVPNNRMTRARRRSANIRAVANPRISWKMFCRGMRLISARKWTLHIHHTGIDGKSRHASINNTEALSTLFERIRESRGIDDNTFNRLLNRWYERLDQQELIKRHKGRKPKGNLERGLTSPTLTWIFFMKGMVLLEVEYFHMELVCIWMGGLATQHTITVNLNNRIQE